MRARCDLREFEKWKAFVGEPRNSPEAMEPVTGVPAADVRGAARLYATARQRRDLLRPGRDRAQPGLDHGDGHRQPGDGHRQPRAGGRGRQSAARPEQRAGLLRHGLVPARVARLPPRLRCARARAVRVGLERDAGPGAGAAHPEHVRGGARRQLPRPVRPGRGHRAVRPQHPARHRRAERDGMHRRAGPVPERDRQVRARVPAGLLVPGEGRHLHQRRAAHLARAQGHAAAVGPRRLGSHRGAVQCARLPDELRPSVARSWTRSRA